MPCRVQLPGKLSTRWTYPCRWHQIVVERPARGPDLAPSYKDTKEYEHPANGQEDKLFVDHEEQLANHLAEKKKGEACLS